MPIENEYIKIHRTREDLAYQLNCIKQLQAFVHRRNFGAIWLSLLIMTVFAIAVNLFTPPDEWIKLKGVATVLTAIFWVLALPVGLWLLTKVYRTKQWIKNSVEQQLTGGEEYFMSFNEEGITHGSAIYKAELKWMYFHHYLESPSAIFLFDRNSLYGFVSFTAAEIGTENLEQLKTIVKEKLPLLNERIVLK